MTSKPVTEHGTSDNGSATLSLPSLDAAQVNWRNGAMGHSNRRLPSPVISPATSSTGLQQAQSRIRAVSRNSREESVGPAARKSHSHSFSSTPHTLASSSRSANAEDKDKQRVVRTLPLWVHSTDDDGGGIHDNGDNDYENVDASSHLLPRTPKFVRPATHHYLPTAKSNVPGRKFDHAREGAPVTLSMPLSDSVYRWKTFAQSSSSGHAKVAASSRAHVVDDTWMHENMPDLEQKWEPIDEGDAQDNLKGFWLFSPTERKRKIVHFHTTMMNHPMVPAVIRMIVLIFSVVALSLAGAIFHKSNGASCSNNSSTWMAIVVDVMAICYTLYITYDEYTSKPLGLRSHNAKMSLIFLDLAFIVFQSANLSLAFEALTDETWACRTSQLVVTTCPYTESICVRQKALTATLLIALFAWIGTFAISTLRLIHRVAR